MPKFIITITEKLIDIPGHTDRKLVGLETDFETQCDEAENGEMSILPYLIPALKTAIEVAQKFAFGPALHSGEGCMADSEQTAVEKAQAAEFPAELAALD
jgi:hypothetical protein